MWKCLVESIGDKLKEQDAILLGNLLVNGKELDALLIRRNSITVIELKDYTGLIHFSENDDWFADEAVVKGGSQRNPYQQVRNNKFALVDRLNPAWKSEFHPQQRKPEFRHISGIVVFRAPAHFDETLPSSVAPWFHITDLDGVAGVAESLHSGLICLEKTEMEWVARTLAGGGLEPARQRIHILYLKQSEFNDAVRRTRQRGGEGMIAVNLLAGFKRKLMNGEDPFHNLESRDREEIRNLQCFELGREYRLAATVLHRTYCLGTLGTIEEVEAWIDTHKGLEFVIDAETGKVTPTKVAGDLGNLPTRATDEAKPYVERVDGIDLVAMEIPSFVAKALGKVNEDNDEAEIGEMLDAAPNWEDRLFLGEVFELLRVGDTDGAQARVDLRNGSAAPVDAMPEKLEEAIDSEENAETMVDLASLDEEDWEKIFEPGRFEEWMVFLHPGQKRVIEEDFGKPAVLTGVSGSGKTCVLVHRARRMAWKHEDERILVLTLNRSLAVLIENLIRRVSSESEFRRIEVRSFHDYLSEVLAELDAEKFLENYGAYTGHRDVIAELLRTPPSGGVSAIFRSLDERDLRGHFQDFFGDLDGEARNARYELEKYLKPKNVDLDVARYLYEELELIRSAFPCYENYDDYVSKYEREGRTIPLDKKLRRHVLDILHAWEEYQLENRFLDHMGLCQAALLAVEENGRIPGTQRFRSVLVDEFQDFSTMDFRLLRVIPEATENGLFITGDFAQKLFAKELDFSRVDMGPKARDLRSIRKNYRNSRQILLAGHKLLEEWPPSIGKDEELAILKPELADRDSAPPIAMKCDDQIAQAWREAQLWLSQGHVAFSVCIATVDPDQLSPEEILEAKPPHIEADALSGDYMLNPSRVIVSDIASIKGFEFSLIIVLGLEEGIYPPPGRAEEEQWRDALRLYVAITRGRDEVRFLYSGEPSKFLLAMEETVSWQEAEEFESITAQSASFLEDVPTVSGIGAPLSLLVPGKGKRTASDGSEPREDYQGDPDSLETTDAVVPEEPRFCMANGYPVAILPRDMNEEKLASFLGKKQTEIALHLQIRHQHFVTPHATLPKHILKDICLLYGYLVDLRG